MDSCVCKQLADICTEPDRGRARRTSVQYPLHLDVLREARGNLIASAKDVVILLEPLLGDLPQELVASVSLNSRGFLVQVAIVGIGTTTACLVHPREVFREAILSNATSIILVHTHPSGDCSPSEEDRELTERVRVAGAVLGIPLLDHVVLGKDEHYSFATEEAW